jgi:hypothetical protein
MKKLTWFVCAAAVAIVLVRITRSDATVLAQQIADRIVVKVNGAMITLSDVRQARLLKLVPGDTDAAIQRGLENRLLILDEVNRSRPGQSGDLEARRRQWEAALGGRSVSELLKTAGMSSGALDDWLRDDVRIQGYLDERFGSVPPAERERAIQRWVDGLRVRADIR